MGYQRAWAYEILEELVFDKGKLVKTVDHSEIAEILRMELLDRKEEGKKTGDDISRFVKECFSLEMKDKAWWMNC